MLPTSQAVLPSIVQRRLSISRGVRAGPARLLRGRHHDALRRLLRMDCEQLQVRHDAGELGPIRGQRLIAVDAEQEVPAFRQVQRHRDAGVIAEVRLVVPLVRQPCAKVGVAVPDDGHALALAVLHHRILLARPMSS